MDDLMVAYDLLQDITATIKNMEYTAFGALWCMMAEEYCRANGLDVTEVSRTMCRMIAEVNDDLGAYL